MTKPKLSSISIAPEHNQPTLSKGQNTFNTLLEKIEKRRMRLSEWDTAVPAFHQQYQHEIVPLEQASRDLRNKMLQRLDQSFDAKGLSKTEQDTMAELICTLAADLIEQCDKGDEAALKAIYNRYSHADYDSETDAELDSIKSEIEAMLGVKLGDDVDLRSPDDIMEHLHAQVEQQQAQEEAAQALRQEDQAQRKKTARQRAAEARAEAKKKELSLSIRQVYRKLASALHPDRETDPQEQKRKTVLMQRVNDAYSKNNLLQLLELQLELEHIDQNSLNNIDDERLKHYNKILKEQVSELDQEILYVEQRFKQSYGISPYASVSPTTIGRLLSKEVSARQQANLGMKQDLSVFNDVRQLKVWLKIVRRSLASMHEE